MERRAKPSQVVASIEDLLLKILLLLPVKDILRFKSVSKHWRTLISDPNFCHLRSINPNRAAGIFLPPAVGRNMNEYVPFSGLNSRRFQLNLSNLYSQSCNGLLLFKYDFSYRVYNPTTDCCLELPEPPVGEGQRHGRYMTLAFDPVKSRHYNVVCMFMRSGYPNQFIIQMYSSDTRSWGVCGEPFPATIIFWNGVYWNGAVHWLSIFSEGGLYFKVENKVLQKMPIIPFSHNGATTHGRKLYFGQSRDHLHLIENPNYGNPFDVYEMKKDYSQWFVKYRVDMSPVISANREMVSIYGNDHVLNLIRGEAEEDSFLVVMISRKIIRYNLVFETFENLYEFENGRPLEQRGLEYIESLCCV